MKTNNAKTNAIIEAYQLLENTETIYTLVTRIVYKGKSARIRCFIVQNNAIVDVTHNVAILLGLSTNSPNGILYHDLSEEKAEHLIEALQKKTSQDYKLIKL